MIGRRAFLLGSAAAAFVAPAAARAFKVTLPSLQGLPCRQSSLIDNTAIDWREPGEPFRAVFTVTRGRDVISETLGFVQEQNGYIRVEPVQIPNIRGGETVTITMTRQII